MPKTLWLVTHARMTLKNEEGNLIPDPEMGPLGFRKVAALRPVLDKLLGDKTPEVHCGTGRRQWQVVRALGFANKSKVLFSSIWGDASTLAELDGIRMVLLGHGLLIPYDCYYSGNHLVEGKVITGIISSLPNNATICSDRSVLVRLGMEPKKCRNGGLYALNVKDNGAVFCSLIQEGKISAS